MPISNSRFADVSDRPARLLGRVSQLDAYLQRPTYYAGHGARASPVLVGGGSSATISALWHPATAIRRVRVLRWTARVLNVSAAPSLIFMSLVHMNSIVIGPGLSEGNGPMDPADPFGETTFTSLPTSVLFDSGDGNVSIAWTGAVAPTHTDIDGYGGEIVLFDWRPETNMKPLIIRPAVLEGWALVCENYRAGDPNVVYTISSRVLFTEE